MRRTQVGLGVGGPVVVKSAGLGCACAGSRMWTRPGDLEGSLDGSVQCVQCPVSERTNYGTTYGIVSCNGQADHVGRVR